MDVVNTMTRATLALLHAMAGQPVDAVDAIIAHE